MEKRKQKNDSNDNPFSFRNFLTTPGSSSNNNESPLSGANSSTNHSAHLSFSPFSNRRRDNVERPANPYSFARYIQNPNQNTPIDNGVLLQGELPDFVQDHFSSSNADINHRNGLPDFTFHTRQDNQLHETGHQVASASLGSSPDDLFVSRLHEDSTRIANSTSVNLPDFLSDTGIITSKENDPPHISDTPTSVVSLSELNGAHSDSIDVDELTTRITELEHESSQKSTRIHQLELQLAAQKRKEEEDTEVMETMMRQVDENLAQAVERWKKSELEVERLTSVVRQLESRLNRSQLDAPESPMHVVRHIGAKLSLDLLAADGILKQLLEHSDKLKVWAGHLQSLDRVEEDREPHLDID